MKQLLSLLLLLLPFCAYSQFEESFSGPTIEANNPWRGDVKSFSIKDGWLVSNADVNRKNVSLTLPVKYAETMQWEFQVSMNFKASNQNHIRMHVYTDYSEMLGSEIDYYLQIGSNNRTISFRRQVANKKTPEVVFEKFVEALSGTVNLKVKITLENSRTWNFYIASQDNFELLANFDLEVFSSNEARSFCYECRYTKTRVNGFACNYINVFHEIFSDSTNLDEVPTLPQLLGIEVLTKSSFLLEYDLPVDIGEAVFSISEIGEAIAKDYVDNSYTKVKLDFAKELEVGVEYDFNCIGVKDLKGNQVADMSSGIYLTYDDGTDNPEEPQKPSFASGSMLINEIMADPPKEGEDLANTEYVELFNTTAETIDLSNWIFYYGDNPVFLSKLQLEAGGYVVLYRSNRNIKIDKPGLAMPLENFPYRMANTGKDLSLVDPSGKVIDKIYYDKALSGISWERSNQDLYYSTDIRGGTPGSKNSSPDSGGEDPDGPDIPVVPENPDTLDIPPSMYIMPKEIIFNELLPDPNIGGSEYIELFNRSDREISLSGLAIAVRKTNGDLGSIYPLATIPFVLQPQDYVALTKNIQGVEPFYLIKDIGTLFQLKLPILANTSSSLVLLNQSDMSVVDEVAYDSEWHSPSVRNEKGISLERIDPEGKTQDPQNWTSASTIDGGGTPGYQNSQYGVDTGGDVTSVEPPVYSDITKEYTINYHLDNSGYTCRAWVFDVSGRQISEVINYELLGVDGTLRWNGLSSNGVKVKTGVYIFYAELVHPEGKIVKVKEAFIVK